VSAALESPVRVDLDPELDDLIAEARAWTARPRRLRERAPAVFVGAGFVAAAAFLIAFGEQERHPTAFAFVALLAAYAMASRVEFEVGPVFALPTQLVLVPMLFILPLRFVPLAVAGGLLAGDAGEAAWRRTRLKLDRIPLRFANSWHALGPACVLLLAARPAIDLAHAPILLAAFAAQCVLDFGSNAALERMRVGLSPRKLARFAAWVYAVDLTLAPIGLAIAYVAVDAPAAVLLVVPLLGLLAFFARERKARIDHALELSSAYRGTAMLLGNVVEADDAYTGSHSRDVVGLTLAVADRLELDARERRDAEFAALLHDVGKVRVPGEVINKDGPLDDAERALMRLHTVWGEEMLAQVGGLLGDVGRIVRACHEDWDGSGYPDGASGEEIPLAARIVSACDAFSAMTTDRPYRGAMTHPQAITELEACAGTQFDPRVVDALVAVASEAPRVR
jgi:HD-GYP domain-containing protein (c-di-GMP phosphodiesterase class II)